MMLQELAREGVTTKTARDLVIDDVIRTDKGPAVVLAVHHETTNSGVEVVRCHVDSPALPDEGRFVGWLSHQEVDLLGSRISGFEPLYAQVFVATSTEPGAPQYDLTPEWQGQTRLVLHVPPGAAEYHRQQGRRALQSELRGLLNAERA